MSEQPFTAEAVLAFLRHVHPALNEEKRLKGDDGLRTTRAVADRFGVAAFQARRVLVRLEDAGEVEAFSDGPHLLWRAALSQAEASKKEEGR